MGCCGRGIVAAASPQYVNPPATESGEPIPEVPRDTSKDWLKDLPHVRLAGAYYGNEAVLKKTKELNTKEKETPEIQIDEE